MEERKIDGELTAKEKKIFEQNPKLPLNQLKRLRSSQEKKMEDPSLMDFSTHNSTFYNRVNFNNSNIFNDTVK